MIRYFSGISVIHSDAKGNYPKEHYNTDFRHNGEFWYYHGRFDEWMASIDNELIRQKIDWINEDIALGFGNMHFMEYYLQKHIDKPWINDICLKNMSNDHLKNFGYTSMSSVRDDDEFIIPRDDYLNIYDPIGAGYYSLELRNKHQMIFYDKRVDALNTQLQGEYYGLYNACRELKKEVNKEFIQLWQKELANYQAKEKSLMQLIKYTKNPELKPDAGFEVCDERWLGLDLSSYVPSSFINMGIIYFEHFSYQNHMSDKNFKVFTRPIDDNYQWALVQFAHGDFQIKHWVEYNPLIMIIHNKTKKPIKHKDVVFQEGFLFLHKNLNFGSYNNVLQIQKSIFINHYINRYIDWMQERVMKVIYDV